MLTSYLATCYQLTTNLSNNTMPTFQAAAKGTHQHLRWKRYTSYTFVAQDTLAPLVAQELVRAVAVFQLAQARPALPG